MNHITHTSEVRSFEDPGAFDVEAHDLVVRPDYGIRTLASMARFVPAGENTEHTSVEVHAWQNGAEVDRVRCDLVDAGGPRTVALSFDVSNHGGDRVRVTIHLPENVLAVLPPEVAEHYVG